MVHPDHETRVGAHRIFSVVLVPTSVFPRSCLSVSDPKAQGIPRTLSRAVSVFSSSAALYEKLRQDKWFSSDNTSQNNNENLASTDQPTSADEVTTNNANRDLVSLAVKIKHYRSNCGPVVVTCVT